MKYCQNCGSKLQSETACDHCRTQQLQTQTKMLHSNCSNLTTINDSGMKIVKVVSFILILFSALGFLVSFAIIIFESMEPIMGYITFLEFLANIMIFFFGLRGVRLNTTEINANHIITMGFAILITRIMYLILTPIFSGNFDGYLLFNSIVGIILSIIYIIGSFLLKKKSKTK